MVYAVRKKLE